eukprot:CAMPEP_0116989690 /NCGR_PEP_ID=MMETSP0467-20121206/64973_1 /TAXON_ID=283647 /ORGANISM="Mesodinium pulex, Strain SPMC105" /LENGTH=240 /DNA_ID=CAMNT_0004686191 /DNA_START=317 /DNA_END=1039 /DNA_ORIENTATION=-
MNLSNPMQYGVGTITTGILVYNHVPELSQNPNLHEKAVQEFETPRPKHETNQPDAWGEKENALIPESKLVGKPEVENLDLQLSTLKGPDSLKNKNKKKRKKAKGGDPKFPQTAEVKTDVMCREANRSVSFWEKESKDFFEFVNWSKFPYRSEELTEEEMLEAKAYMINNDMDFKKMQCNFNKMNPIRMKLWNQAAQENNVQAKQIDWNEYRRTEKIRWGRPKDITEDERNAALEINKKMH